MFTLETSWIPEDSLTGLTDKEVSNIAYKIHLAQLIRRDLLPKELVVLSDDPFANEVRSAAQPEIERLPYAEGI